MKRDAYDNLMLAAMAVLFALCMYALGDLALCRKDPDQEDLDVRLPATQCQYVGCARPQQKSATIHVTVGYARRGGTYVRKATYALCSEHLQMEAANRWPLAAWWRWLLALGVLVVVSGVLAMTGAVLLVHVPLSLRGLVPKEPAPGPVPPPEDGAPATGGARSRAVPRPAVVLVCVLLLAVPAVLWQIDVADVGRALGTTPADPRAAAVKSTIAWAKAELDRTRGTSGQAMLARVALGSQLEQGGDVLTYLASIAPADDAAPPLVHGRPTQAYSITISWDRQKVFLNGYGDDLAKPLVSETAEIWPGYFENR